MRAKYLVTILPYAEQRPVNIILEVVPQDLLAELQKLPGVVTFVSDAMPQEQNLNPD